MVIRAFEFFSKQKLIFGQGKIELLPGLVKPYGNNILLLSGKNTILHNPVIERISLSISQSGKTVFSETLHGEPSPATINDLVMRYSGKEISLVIAIGGGSIMDAGKAISAMLPSGNKVDDFLENVGTQQHNGNKIPFFAVPTTAGTGSEATKNAVLSIISEHGFKRSLRHDNFIPDLALVDPLLTINCPPGVTAAGGLDAFTQLLESYVSTKASLVTDSLAFTGLEMVKDSLPEAFHDGNNTEARSAMALAAYISGITLSNAGLGLVHGFASSIGGVADIPHGVICGTLLGACTEETIKELILTNNTDVLGKYARVGYLLSGISGTPGSQKENIKGCELLIQKIELWTETMKIPKLGEFGLKADAIDFIVEETDNKLNPANLSKEAIRRILISRM